MPEDKAEESLSINIDTSELVDAVQGAAMDAAHDHLRDMLRHSYGTPTDARAAINTFVEAAFTRVLADPEMMLDITAFIREHLKAKAEEKVAAYIARTPVAKLTKG